MEFFKKHKRDILLAFLLILVVSVHIGEFFSLEKLPFLDPTTGQSPRIFAFKESISKYGDYFPIWNPYINSGEPLTDAIFQGLDSPTGILVVLFPTLTGLNLSYFLAILFGAIFMFIFAKYVFNDSYVAFLVALTYSGAGYIMNMLVTSSLHQLHAYALNPLILLFTFKAF